MRNFSLANSLRPSKLLEESISHQHPCYQRPCPLFRSRYGGHEHSTVLDHIFWSLNRVVLLCGWADHLNPSQVLCLTRCSEGSSQLGTASISWDLLFDRTLQSSWNSECWEYLAPYWPFHMPSHIAWTFWFGSSTNHCECNIYLCRSWSSRNNRW